MFYIIWDTKTGGVKLSTHVTKETLGISPRPVFYEELDLLGLDRLGWTYPRCQEPLLWAVNKQYYYRGELVFEAKGANLYDAPTIHLAPGKEKLTLTPVDVAEMLRRNQDFMFLIESEAIEFIRDVFVQYSSASRSVERVKANQIDFEALREKLEKRTKTKMAIVREDCDSFDIMPLDEAAKQGKREYKATKIDRFIASFSGGKDSQVILDLCTRAIPSTDFEVIYSDTGYELPPSLELYDTVRKFYGERFPKLKFTLARNHESVLNYWDKIGTPSDTHRWCCKIMKTAPIYRALKIDGNRQAKVLTFEGVRAEESNKRSEYGRVGRAVKHSTTVNARPIFHWTTIEVFLYLFGHTLPINPAYRYGKARVGCLVCPYSSCWDDMIDNHFFPISIKPFIDRLTSYAIDQGVVDVKNYITSRNWKFRASGNTLKNDTRILFSADKTNFKVRIFKPETDLFDWLPILGKISISRNTSKSANGEIQYGKDVYSWEYQNKANEINFVVHGARDIKFQTLLRRIIYKTAYCIQCESCEVECPTGALSVYPKIKVDTDKCAHCFNCLYFHDKGCIVANSINMTTGTSVKSKTGIDRYSTFGLHEEWLEEFLADPKSFWGKGSLGKKQIMGFRSWLKEAEIINEEFALTELGGSLASLIRDGGPSVWEIILVNLAYNSFIVKWVLQNIALGTPYDNNTIDETIKMEYGDTYGLKTIQNARAAFMQLMKYSPIGENLKLGVADGKKRIHLPYSDITLEGVAYSLYKYGQTKGINTFRVSDLYREEEDCGIFREFGISQDDLKKKLRALSTDSNRVLIAELNMGLDHITLRDDLTPLTALQQLLD